MSPCLVILWLALTQVPPPPPQADPTLRWSAPVECPDRDAVLRGITDRRGRPLAPGEASVDATVEHQGPRYLLRLHVRAGARSERRELSADSCRSLADATALLVSLAVDAAASEPRPGRVEPRPARSSPPQPSTSPGDPDSAPEIPAAHDSPPANDTATVPNDPRDPLEPPADAPRAPVDPPTLAPPLPATTSRVPAVPRRAGALLRLHAGPELGAVPGVSAAVGLAVGVLLPRLRLELQGTFVAPRGVPRAQGEVRAWLLAAAAHVCARPRRGALEFPLCGGLELGGMHGAVRGPELDRAGFGVWFGGVLGAGVAWRFHPRLAVWTALQALAAVRPSFHLDDPRGRVVLFEPPPVSGRLLLGLELRLGTPR